MERLLLRDSEFFRQVDALTALTSENRLLLETLFQQDRKTDRPHKE